MWESFGKHLEASGRHLGGIWEASGRHLRGIWGIWGILETSQEAPKAPRAPEGSWTQKVIHLSAKMQKFPENVDFARVL